MGIDPKAMAERDALWEATNDKLDASTLTRSEWVAHLKAESTLGERDDRITLEAILVVGMEQGFIKTVSDAAELLGEGATPLRA